MRASGLGFFLRVLLIAACGDDPKPPVMAAEPRDDGGLDNECVDEDGDGAGRRCGMSDCDDNDPDVTNECIRCNVPNENCPCEEGTEPEVDCTPENLGEQREQNGQLLECTKGVRYCHEPAGLAGTFVWTACEGVFTLASQ